MTCSNIISLNHLADEPYASILCYPKPSTKQLASRIKELVSLGITGIEFSGSKKISNLQVLGKGCVGVVVAAYRNQHKTALKIRRVDADRENMRHEAEMLKLANNISVGPKLLAETSNFLLMEFIEGNTLHEWVKALEGRSQRILIRKVLREILEQCWRLDQAGLDHGELSNAPKHIIVNASDKPVIIDFETASVNRKPANVTSICQYLFIGSQAAKTLAEKLGNIDHEKLRAKLRRLKLHKTRKNFEDVLKHVELREGSHKIFIVKAQRQYTR